MTYTVAGLIGDRLQILVRNKAVGRIRGSGLAVHDDWPEGTTGGKNKLLKSTECERQAQAWRLLADEDSKSLPMLELRRLKFVI